MSIIRLYGKFKQIGYTNFKINLKKIEIRPDNSIGKGFSEFIQIKYKDVNIDSIRKCYKHILPNKLEVNYYQYYNNCLADFIYYVENIWLIERSPKYLKDRDPDSISHLSKVINLIENKT